MVKWDFSLESNNQKEIWELRDVEADCFKEALGKLSKKQLEKLLVAMKKSQKELNVARKKRPKHSFEASISTRTNFGGKYIPLGINLISVKADSIEELLEKVSKLKPQKIEEKAKREHKDKDNIEMFVLDKKCTLMVSTFTELEYKDVKELLRDKT